MGSSSSSSATSPHYQPALGAGHSQEHLALSQGFRQLSALPLFAHLIAHTAGGAGKNPWTASHLIFMSNLRRAVRFSKTSLWEAVLSPKSVQHKTIAGIKKHLSWSSFCAPFIYAALLLDGWQQVRTFHTLEDFILCYRGVLRFQGCAEQRNPS